MYLLMAVTGGNQSIYRFTVSGDLSTDGLRGYSKNAVTLNNSGVSDKLLSVIRWVGF